MKIKDIKQNLLYVLAIGISIFLLFFVITISWINNDVRESCQEARREYGESCIQSLIKILEDEGRGYKARNSAVWTLGQLADKQALPILKKYYTGKIPPRESLYKTLSQYELKKSIKWCEEGNITSWMYKGF